MQTTTNVLTLPQARMICTARRVTGFVASVILGVLLLLAAGIVNSSPFSGQTVLLCTALSLVYVIALRGAIMAIETVEDAIFMPGRDFFEPLVNFVGWVCFMFGPALLVFYVGSRIGLNPSSGWPVVDACNQGSTTWMVSAFASFMFSLAVAAARMGTDYLNEITMLYVGEPRR